MSGTNKLAADKNQRILLELVNQPGNDVCADCKARNPRWASHNLGIFICVNCASIHRKIGTHVTKVKSVTLDTWTKDQVETMKQIGNVKSNAKHNPDETRFPPPANLIDQERDSELEKYIRAKYEFKTFMKRANNPPAESPQSKSLKGQASCLTPSSSIDRSAAVAALLGPSRSLASRSSTISSTRQSTASVSSSAPATSSVPPAVPPKTAPPSSIVPSSSNPPAQTPSSAPLSQVRSVSQTLPSSSSLPARPATSSTLGDLQSLQPRTIDATLPLQVVSTPTSAPLPIPTTTPTPYLSAPNPFFNASASSAPAYVSSFGQTTGISPGSMGAGMNLSPSMNTGLGTSYSSGNISPFQSSPMNSTVPLSSTPSPNPFSPQALPGNAVSGSFGAQPLGNNATGFASQPQTPFGGPMYTGQQFAQQQPVQQQQFAAQQHQQFVPQQPMQGQMFSQPQMQYAQPQAQMQMQMQTPGNPFMQNQTSPSPFMAGSQFGATPSPSPYGAQQAMPQMTGMQQQPQQTGFGAGNPFTSWIQQPPAQQGGYAQQPQWGM